MRQKHKKIYSIIYVLFFMMVFSGSSAGEISNRVVAIVNDDCITLYELNKTIEEWTGFGPEILRARNENEFIETRNRILEHLIDQKIAKAKIQELGIVITPRQIDAAIERIKRDNKITHEDLLAELESRGITYDKYRENIKKELEQFHLINAEVKSKIIIREESLKEYYRQHLDDYRVEEKIRLASIYLERRGKKESKNPDALMERMKKILERLKNGEDFNGVAEEVAPDNGKALNGDFGLFKESQLEESLAELLREIPEGGISEPILRPNGIQIIKVVKRQKEGVKSFDEVRNAIYSKFYREEVEKRYMAWLKELRKHAYTKIIF